jgi:hypothetical protein
MATVSRGTRTSAGQEQVNSSLGSGPTPQPNTADDPFGGLAGEDRDAYAALTNMLKQYGLESLSGVVLNYIQDGYSEDTISLLLPETNEYKQRFSANDTRKKAGLSVLTPAEYLSLESSYRQLMQAAGLPVGFYDSNDDFTGWIAGDVSPTEVASRVQVASDLVNSADSATKDYFSRYYSHGDMVAYALDQAKAAPIIQQQYKNAQVGGAAAAQGLNVSQATIENLAKQGVTQNQAQTGFGFVATEMPNANKLADIYGQSQLSTDDLISETFSSDSAVSEKRKGLASRERATFNGSSAANKTSLNRETAGQI